MRIIKRLFKRKHEEEVAASEQEDIKITGTKWYVDIEYQGNIARFDGTLGLNEFAAIASPMTWVRHAGPVKEGELLELMCAVREYCKRKNDGSKIVFTDEEYRDLEY